MNEIDYLDEEITLELHAQGKDAWNKYMREHPDTNVKFFSDLRNNLDFAGFIFPRKANFARAEFLTSHKCNFSGAEFRGECDFSGAEFRGLSDFSRAGFSKKCDFSFASFQGLSLFEECNFRNECKYTHAEFLNVSFNCSSFYKKADFIKCKFNVLNPNLTIPAKLPRDYRENKKSNENFIQDFRKNPIWYHDRSVYFVSTIFHMNIDFGHSLFAGQAYFNDIEIQKVGSFESCFFSVVPSFLQTKIPCDVFNRIEVAYPTQKSTLWNKENRPPNESWVKKLFSKTSNESATGYYRKLKQLAIESKNHDQEQKFFAMEIKSKRFHEETSFFSMALSVAYGSVSNFGFSILRPFMWLVFLTLLCTACFYCLSSTKNFWLALFYSLSNCLPFGGLWRQSEYLFQQLFPCAESWSSVQQLTYYSLITLNGLFGFIFIFLIGLGLRNRFRL